MLLFYHTFNKLFDINVVSSDDKWTFYNQILPPKYLSITIK